MPPTNDLTLAQRLSIAADKLAECGLEDLAAACREADEIIRTAPHAQYAAIFHWLVQRRASLDFGDLDPPLGLRIRIDLRAKGERFGWQRFFSRRELALDNINDVAAYEILGGIQGINRNVAECPEPNTDP